MLILNSGAYFPHFFYFLLTLISTVHYKYTYMCTTRLPPFLQYMYFCIIYIYFILDHGFVGWLQYLQYI